MPLAKIRKAVVAGLTAGAGAAVAVLAKSEALDSTTIGQAAAAFVATAVVAGWATWRTVNAPA